jgi:hypothetical protein
LRFRQLKSRWNATAFAEQTGEAGIEIDPHSDAISHALDDGGAVYRKTGEIRARRAVATRAVVTVLADGTEETKNTAAPGDFIVTGPGGEEYVLKRDTFLARYRAKPRKRGVYLPCGTIVAAPNPFACSISLKAPWGEMQNGSADCVIADTIDPKTGKRKRQPYLIARAEFERTYTRSA